MAAKLKSRIPQIQIKLAAESEAVAFEGATLVQKEAAARAPRLKQAIITPSFTRYVGELADSIEVIPIGSAGITSGGYSGRSARPAVGVGPFVVRPGVYWGRYVEEGTIYADAQPYMEPASLAVEADIVALEERVLADL